MAGKSLSDIKEIFLGYYFLGSARDSKNCRKIWKKLLKESIVGIHDFSEDDDSFLMPVTEWQSGINLELRELGITSQ